MHSLEVALVTNLLLPGQDKTLAATVDPIIDGVGRSIGGLARLAAGIVSVGALVLLLHFAA